MKSSDQINELATALSIAQGQLNNVSKGSENPYFKSKYADLAECMQACRKPLSDNGLSIVQGPSLREDGAVVVSTRLLHSSGQWIESDVAATPKDSGPQSIGSVITYLKRYSLCAIIGLVTEDEVDDDGNAGQGRGREESTNSMACPACHKTEFVRESRDANDLQFYCWKTKGGCGHKWNAGEQPKQAPPANPAARQPPAEQKSASPPAAPAKLPATKLDRAKERLKLMKSFSSMTTIFESEIQDFTAPEEDAGYRRAAMDWIIEVLPKLNVARPEHFDAMRTWLKGHFPDQEMQDELTMAINVRQRETEKAPA